MPIHIASFQKNWYNAIKKQFRSLEADIASIDKIVMGNKKFSLHQNRRVVFPG